MQVHGFLEVIDAQAVLSTHRARERAGGARRTQCVIGGEQRQLAFAQAIDARIPNMDQMGTPPAQNQCAQGAGHAVQFRVGAPHRVDPAIHGIRGRRADARDAHRGLLSETAFDEASHGQFRGHAASLGAPHAIGQCRHEADS